jgi:CRP/FNR family cyclic AMP-dependent transcriptional regulator
MDSFEVDLLSKIQLFHSLSPEELKGIRNEMVIKKFKKNEFILYEEDTNKCMYSILDGGVRVVKATEDGKEILLAIHRAGDSFGEISLIDSKTTTAAVIASGDALVAIIPKENFYSLISTQKKVLDNLLKILCSRIRENVDKIKILNFNNANQRLTMLLIKLSRERGRETPQGIALDIRLTHQDLADMTGLTRETVTRVIDKWQNEGTITVLKDKSILLGPNFMEEI